MSKNDIGLAILVMALWGLHYVVIRAGALEIPPFMLLSFRFFLCALVFMPFARKISWNEFKNVLFYSIPFQGLHMGLLFAGLAQVDASLSGLIMKSGVPFSIFLAWFIYKERFGLKTTLGLLTALAGGVLMVYAPHENASITITGILFLLGSALFWAIGSIRLKYIKDLNFPTMIGYSFMSALPIAIITSLMTETNHIEALKQANHLVLGSVLAYQVILVSLSHYWWKVIVSRNPIYLVTPFSLLTPLFGIGFGILLLGEQLSPTTIAGGTIALIGIAIITLRKAKKEKELIS